MRADGGDPFVFAAELAAIATPGNAAGWVQLGGLVAFGAAMGLFAAAVRAARSGAGFDLAEASPGADARRG